MCSWMHLATAVLQLWLVTVCAIQERDEKLIGWRGPTYHPEEVWGDGTAGKKLTAAGSNEDKVRWIELVSWQPRAFVYHNFLTHEECDHIIRLAAPQMRRSTVVGENGTIMMDEIRTSHGCFVHRLLDDVIEEIEMRVANWTQIPAIHQEDMQVLRYANGQKYGAHYDVLEDNTPRIATVLMYLTDVEQGGETAFPVNSQWIDRELAERHGPWSNCAKGHVAVKPKKGTAMLFFSLKPDGTADEASMHTGCPVEKGVKWTATKWIHTKPFFAESFRRPQPEEIPGDPGICKDDNRQCPEWGKNGECTKNPDYMIGGPNSIGACRATCKVCEVCGELDKDCYNRNRERAGYVSLEEDLFTETK